MLVLSRAPGEALLIGQSKLVVRRIAPTIGIVWSRPGLTRDFEFERKDLARQPVIDFEGVQVKLLRIEHSGLTLGIEAPRHIAVLRAEAKRQAPISNP